MPLSSPKNIVSPDLQDLKIMHSNLLSTNKRYGIFVDYVLEIDPDVLLMEEFTQGWYENTSELHTQYPFRKSVPRPDNFGIALFSKYPLSNLEVNYFIKGGVPSITCDIDVDNKYIHFVGTHPLPPIGDKFAHERNLQLKLIAEHCNNQSILPVVVIGDLNMSHWSYYYKLLENRTNLRNSSYGFGIQRTWPNSIILSPISTPIDHCLVSETINVNNRFVGKDVGSDHYPIVLEISF